VTLARRAVVAGATPESVPPAPSMPAGRIYSRTRPALPATAPWFPDASPEVAWRPSAPFGSETGAAWRSASVGVRPHISGQRPGWEYLVG